MIALRRDSAALRHGGIRLIDEDSDSIVAFEREADGDRLLCVFNLSAAPAINPRPSSMALAITGGADPAASTLPPASGFIAPC